MINAATVALCRFCVAQGQRSQGALLRAFWLCRLLLPFIMAAQLVVGAVYQFSIIFTKSSGLRLLLSRTSTLLR